MDCICAYYVHVGIQGSSPQVGLCEERQYAGGEEQDYDITTLKKGERLRWKGKGQLGRSPSYGKGGVVRTRGKD